MVTYSKFVTMANSYIILQFLNTE